MSGPTLQDYADCLGFDDCWNTPPSEDQHATHYDREAEALLCEADDFWLRGWPLPMDIAAQLMAKGIDVGALEAQRLD